MAPLGFGKLLKGRSLTPEELRRLVESEHDGWVKTLVHSFDSKEETMRAEAA